MWPERLGGVRQGQDEKVVGPYMSLSVWQWGELVNKFSLEVFLLICSFYFS